MCAKATAPGADEAGTASSWVLVTSADTQLPSAHMLSPGTVPASRAERFLTYFSWYPRTDTALDLVMISTLHLDTFGLFYAQRIYLCACDLSSARDNAGLFWNDQRDLLTVPYTHAMRNFGLHFNREKKTSLSNISPPGYLPPQGPHVQG